MTDDAPLTFAGTLDRGSLTAATALLVDLVADPAVAARWDQESACAGMSVGALAAHLTVQPRRVVELLPTGPTHLEPISLEQHYDAVPWLQQGLDGPANVGVVERSQEEADAGPASVVAAARDVQARLDEALTLRPTAVLLPWQGTALATDDFLVTRLMEIVVHSDDLAASVDLPTPRFTASTLDPVLALLTRLALLRHGQDAVVRALSRPQRAPGTITAF